MQQNFKSVLQTGLGKLDLVTREEFDVQRAVLLRTREQLDALEDRLAALEARRPARPATRRNAEPAAMGLALVHSRARVGVHAPAVRVEVHLAGGLPTMSIVGLPEAAVREAKDRVRAAIQCGQFEFPARRITVNLAPADLPKHGGRFDLAIALGILAASGQVPIEALHDCEFLGELGLTGQLRAVDGVLPAPLAAARAADAA